MTIEIIENGESIPTIPTRRRVIGGARQESSSLCKAGFRFYQLGKRIATVAPNGDTYELVNGRWDGMGETTIDSYDLRKKHGA